MRRGHRISVTLAIMVLIVSFGLFAFQPLAVAAASPSIVITRVSTASKRIALTFDFGSDAGNVAAILKVLSDYQVPSTFFITGDSAVRYPSSVRSVAGGGHEIGNHTYSHPHMRDMSAAAMRDEILRGESAIRSVTGQLPKKIFRPPYGEYNSTVLQVAGDAGYPYTVMWSVSTVDWKGIPADEIRQRALDGAAPGAIILMHVGSGTHTPEALPGIITGLRGMGYQLVTVTSLLGQSGGSFTYTVKPGDTLYSIARYFGVTVQSIVDANGIVDPNRIYVGQVLTIRKSAPPPPATSFTYTVKPGDTLYSIARYFGVTVQSIVDANGIVDPNRIYVGQVLIIRK